MPFAFLHMSASLFLATVGSALVSTSVLPKRAADVTNPFTLYAYSTNFTGLPVLYANSLAYIGENGPSNASLSTNTTFSLNSTSLYASVNTTSSANTNASIGTPLLSINTTSGSNSQISFVSSTNSTSDSTTDFLFYGNQLFWSNGSDLMASFYAQQTSESDVWELLWVEDGSISASASIQPVTLKTTAPPASS